jgi:D-alanyl-D-alanine carboxypeptidase
MNHPHPRRRPAVAWSIRAALAGAAALLTAACTLPATTGANPAATPIAPPTGVLPVPPKLQAALNKIVADGVPGVVVRIRRGNDVATLASGVGTIATGSAFGVPARTNDHFRIASQTKPFVATVILQLVAEGKLQLTDRVDQLLPGVLPRATAVTVQQILTHTSGLKDYLNDATKERLTDVTIPVLQPYFGRGDVNYVWAPAQLVAKAPRSLLGVPRLGYHYSNTNYVLAGMVVEKVTGNPLGDEIKRRILDALGLKQTSFSTSISMPAPYLHGYEFGMPKNNRWPDGNDLTRLSPSIFAGAGAMVSTVADLETFYRNLLTTKGSLLKNPEKTAMQNVMAGSSYGLGIQKTKTACGTFWGHDGSAFGYFSHTLVTQDDSREAEIAINANWRKGQKTLDEDLKTIEKLALCDETGTPLPTPLDLAETQRAADAIDSPDEQY